MAKDLYLYLKLKPFSNHLILGLKVINLQKNVGLAKLLVDLLRVKKSKPKEKIDFRVINKWSWVEAENHIKKMRVARNIRKLWRSLVWVILNQSKSFLKNL